MAFMADISRNSARDTGKNAALTSYEWEIDITPPNAVYWPGDSLIKIRLTEVTVPGQGGSNNENGVVVLRGGFKLHQGGLTKNSDEPLVLHLQDFEDQAVIAMLEDWITKKSTRDTQRGVHKRDYISDLITVRRLNVFRVPVREWRCEGCIPNVATYDDVFNSEKGLLGKEQLAFDVDYWETQLLNV